MVPGTVHHNKQSFFYASVEFYATQDDGWTLPGTCRYQVQYEYVGIDLPYLLFIYGQYLALIVLYWYTDHDRTILYPLVLGLCCQLFDNTGIRPKR